jgi:hypothetical protein
LPTSDSNQSEPNDDNRRASDEALDRLLDAAAWPETPPLVLARLEKQWRDVSPASLTWKRRRRWTLVAAAALLVATGIYAWWPVGDAANDPQIAVQDADRLNTSSVDQPSEATVDDASKPAATDVEQPESVKKKTYKRRPRTRRQWLAYLKKVDKTVIAAVDRLAETGQWTRDQVANAAEPLQGERTYCIQQLARHASTRKSPAGHAAFDLLIELAGDRVDIGPILSQLVTVPNCHARALRELAPRLDTATLVAFVQLEKDETLQQYLLRQLLRRSEVESVGVYLDLIADLRTRRPALQVLRKSDLKPAATLLSFLQQGSQRRSSAAILALAEIDDPQVVQRLGRMVLANVDRQAALMTLMVRSDPQSLRFLSQLSKAPAFTGDLLSARNRLAAMVMVNHIATQES